MQSIDTEGLKCGEDDKDSGPSVVEWEGKVDK